MIFWSRCLSGIIKVDVVIGWGPHLRQCIIYRMQKTPGAHSHGEKADACKPSRRASGGSSSANTLFLGFQTPELWASKGLLCRPHSLWCVPRTEVLSKGYSYLVGVHVEGWGYFLMAQGLGKASAAEEQRLGSKTFFFFFFGTYTSRALGASALTLWMRSLLWGSLF